MNKKQLLEFDLLEKYRQLNEDTNTARTKQWLNSFLNASGVDYEMHGPTLILFDDMYRVELRIIGGEAYV